MITKERLEELIDKGARIYDIFKGDIYPIDLTMSKYYDVPKYIEYKNDYYNCVLTRNIYDLFETKEDAEFSLRYKRVPHTEYLDLPTFDEMQETLKLKNIMTYEFIGNNDICALVVDKIDNNIQVVGVGGGYDKWDLTKENYYDACEICRKLFLGENYEAD